MQEAKFRNKIRILSFVSAVLVVFIHAYNVNAKSPFFIKWTEIVISQDIAQCAVPMFFAISAFLFYRNFDYTKIMKKYKSRFFGLVVPFLLWNGIYFVCFFILSRYDFINTEPFDINIHTLINGLIFYEYNSVFWFMFQLIIFVLLSPVIYTVVKNKPAAVLAMLFFGVLFSAGIKELVFIKTDSMTYYLIGAFAALHYEDAVITPSKKRAGYAVLLLCVSQLLFAADLMYGHNLLHLMFRISLFISVFCMYDLIEFQAPSFCDFSFALYAMHVLILEMFQKVFSMIFGNEGIWLITDYFVSAGVSIFIVVFIAKTIKRYIPAVYRIVFGGR